MVKKCFWSQWLPLSWIKSFLGSVKKSVCLFKFPSVFMPQWRRVFLLSVCMSCWAIQVSLESFIFCNQNMFCVILIRPKKKKKNISHPPPHCVFKQSITVHHVRKEIVLEKLTNQWNNKAGFHFKTSKNGCCMAKECSKFRGD